MLLSTTTKELEGKLKTLFTTLVADQADKIATIRLSMTLPPAQIATAIGILVLTNPADPLQTWVNITYLVTTKASGNKKIDQYAATVSFANLRRRPSESIFDYCARAENVFQSYKLPELDPLLPATVAMRFTQGLDPTKYGSMQTLFANELHFGPSIRNRKCHKVPTHYTAQLRYHIPSGNLWCHENTTIFNENGERSG